MNKVEFVLDVIPKKIVTKLIGKATKMKASKMLIKPYSKMYKINLNEVEKDIKEYGTLNEFFTRKLKENAREIEKEEVVSPVDGWIKEAGIIEKGKMIQVKGVTYNIKNLLGDKRSWEEFEGGTYVNIYLSPKNYHRIHSPIEGTIRKYEHIEGKLYPVNKLGIENVEELYSKNERVNVYLSNDTYNVAMANVGALIVGSVQMKDVSIEKNKIKQRTKKINKGEEIGHFEFGSTVVLMIKNKQEEKRSYVKANREIRLGQRLF